MLIWICGVSGSGKTTLGQALHKVLKPRNAALFLLDGDDFRAAMGDALGYSPQERAANARRIARLCHLLGAQGIDVICCAVTLPDEVQSLNRSQTHGYLEIYMEVSKETLLRRDPKGLYRECARGKLSNLPGFDIAYHPPRSPHLVFDNNQDLSSLDGFVRQVLSHLETASMGKPRIHA